MTSENSRRSYRPDQLLDPLGVMISAFAGLLRREARVGLAETENLVHEVTFAQVRISIDYLNGLLGFPVVMVIFLMP